MRDFVNPGRDIDVQELLKMAEAAEKRPEKLFDMEYWSVEYDCGTAGCLVGTYLMDVKGGSMDPLYATLDAYSLMRELGLTVPESLFLFTNHPWMLRGSRAAAAYTLNQQQAIRRLRKFLIYKMRKAELLEDYDLAKGLSDINATLIEEKEYDSAAV